MRDVTSKDSQKLLEWRNEPGIRKFSRSQGFISKKSHSEWLGNRLKLIPEQPFWIFENDLGIIGFIRFDLNLALLHFEISIVVDPKLRGKGFGRIILTHAVETCLARNPGFNLYAEAHIENLTSHLLFLKCGFQKCELKKDFLVFKRSANPN